MWMLSISLFLTGQVRLQASPVVQSTTPEKVAIHSSHTSHEVIYRMTRDLRPGQMKRTVEGNSTILLFNPGTTTSRSSYTRESVGVFVATAYAPTEGSKTGKTATGRSARYGIIAVDPRVIPLGSTCFVEGYGFAVAADTGGAIKGHRIDVCYPTVQQCNRWGRKKVVVHVFKEREFQWKHRSRHTPKHIPKHKSRHHSTHYSSKKHVKRD